MTRQETAARREEQASLDAGANWPPTVANKPQASTPGMTEVRTTDPRTAQPVVSPPPERAVAFQTSGLSGSPAAYPFVSAGGVVQCDDGQNAKQQRPDGGNKNVQEHDAGQQQADESQEAGEEDQRATGRVLSVHAGRDVYVSSGEESQKKGEQEEKKDDHGQKKGEEGQQKSGKHQGNGKASKDNKQGQDEHEPSKGHQQSDDEKDNEEQKSDRHQQHGRPHRRNKKDQLKRKLPRWPTLLVTCVLALVCGVGGAWGYSALFASGQANHGKDSGKGGKSGGEKSGESNSDQGSTDDIKKGLQQLADNMDQLGTRIDRLNQTAQEAKTPVPQYYPGSSRIERMAPAGDGSAPIPTAVQTQLTVLERKVEQMDDVPGRVQELERCVTELQEAIKILVEARAASDSVGR